MTPILYEPYEQEFTSNGLGRLRDIIRCECTEERNGIYVVEFDYPVTGLHFDDIYPGRIIAATHDENGDVQPFIIYGNTEPINGIVTFYAHHISYRLNGIVSTLSNINNPTAAFNWLVRNSKPSNPFSFSTDVVGNSYLPYSDGVPRSVRDFLGGGEGSIVDTYGGEYEFNMGYVTLWERRGTLRDITIRYGVNMTEFSQDLDYSESYNACLPYWKNDSTIIVGAVQTLDNAHYDGIDYCVPLDVTDRFASQPTAGLVGLEGLKYMRNNQTYLPSRNIKVNFIKLADTDEYKQFAPLQKCVLCDSVTVVFPRYNMKGTFKIVKVVWDVLQERYTEMELGNLSISLAEALGIK